METIVQSARCVFVGQILPVLGDFEYLCTMIQRQTNTPQRKPGKRPRKGDSWILPETDWTDKTLPLLETWERNREEALRNWEEGIQKLSGNWRT